MAVSLADLVAQILADEPKKARKRGDGNAKCPMCKTGERTRNGLTGEPYAYCSPCLVEKNRIYRRQRAAKAVPKDNS